MSPDSRNIGAVLRFSKLQELARTVVGRWRRIPPAWRRIAGGALLAAAMVLVFAASGYLTLWLGARAEVVDVPDLLGRPMPEAERLLAAAGLRPREIDRRHDARIGAGRVLRQVPEPGSSTKMGRTVKITLSLGPRLATVPDLRGGSLRRAEISLGARGLRVGTHARVSSEEAAMGNVIHQIPPPDSEAWPGAGISLLLSAGRARQAYVMPDLVGRDRRQAESWIASRGLRLGRVARRPAEGRIPGTILAQRPPAGHPLDPRAPVALTVAEREASPP